MDPLYLHEQYQLKPIALIINSFMYKVSGHNFVHLAVFKLRYGGCLSNVDKYNKTKL